MKMPITREEKLLNSIANGVYSGVQPVTREEQYLSYIAGETYTKPDEPITRKEVFLDKIPQGGSSGGGVTIRNQNKTITENGTYTADSGYTGLGTVTVNVESSGSTGKSKLAQYADGTLTKLMPEDLAGVETIRNSAFGSATWTSITLPSTVTKIDGYAFSSNKSLTDVTLLTDADVYFNIMGNAFSYCESLKTITVKQSVRQIYIQASTFNNCPALEKIIVPNGCGEMYKTATNWSAYADIIVEEGN
jgi:hypothetical protein